MIATIIKVARIIPLAEYNKLDLIKIKNITKLGSAQRLIIWVNIFKSKNNSKNSPNDFSVYLNCQKIINDNKGTHRPEIRPLVKELNIVLLTAIIFH